MPSRSTLILYSLLALAACAPDEEKTSAGSSSSSGGASSGGASSGSETADEPTSGVTEPTTGPTPDDVRECQPGDFRCTEEDCEPWMEVSTFPKRPCFKPCTPDVIGEVDSECDEPGRPFCSQLGQFKGGDFNCNGCVHICSSESINYCDSPVSNCDP